MNSDEARPGAGPQSGIGPREALRPGLWWPERRDSTRSKGPTHPVTRSQGYRRSSYGRYVPAGIEQTTPQRIVEAYAIHRTAVVTGWAALLWLGGRWFDRAPSYPVPLVLTENEGRSRQPHLVQVSQEFLHPKDVCRVDGIRVTSAVRSVAYEMRRAPSPLRAAQAFSMAAYDDLVSREELTRFCKDELPRWAGVGRVRDVLALLTENAWSPTEVTMGWAWTHARPHARIAYNVPVFSLDGRHLGTPDGLDLDAGVVAEYQGALHLAGERRAQDVVRDDVLIGAGIEMAIMLSADLADPRRFLRRLDGAYERARGRPRRWTVDPPPWWIDTTTVAARRALDRRQRDRLLGYRRAA